MGVVSILTIIHRNHMDRQLSSTSLFTQLWSSGDRGTSSSSLNIALRPQRPRGQGAENVHLNSYTAPEVCCWGELTPNVTNATSWMIYTLRWAAMRTILMFHQRRLIISLTSNYRYGSWRLHPELRIVVAVMAVLHVRNHKTANVCTRAPDS